MDDSEFHVIDGSLRLDDPEYQAEMLAYEENQRAMADYFERARKWRAQQDALPMRPLFKGEVATLPPNVVQELRPGASLEALPGMLPQSPYVLRNVDTKQLVEKPLEILPQRGWQTDAAKPEWAESTDDERRDQKAMDDHINKLLPKHKPVSRTVVKTRHFVDSPVRLSDDDPIPETCNEPMGLVLVIIACLLGILLVSQLVKRKCQDASTEPSSPPASEPSKPLPPTQPAPSAPTPEPSKPAPLYDPNVSMFA